MSTPTCSDPSSGGWTLGLGPTPSSSLPDILFPSPLPHYVMGRPTLPSPWKSSMHRPKRSTVDFQGGPPTFEWKLLFCHLRRTAQKVTSSSSTYFLVVFLSLVTDCNGLVHLEHFSTFPLVELQGHGVLHGDSQFYTCYFERSERSVWQGGNFYVAK